MSQDAMMVFEEVSRKEIIIRHVPIQENRELPHAIAPSLSSLPDEMLADGTLATESLATQTLAPVINRVVLRMEEFVTQFNTAVNTATKDLIHRIDSSIETALPARSISAARLKVMTAENEFLGKVLEASRQINAQRQILIDEIQNLGGPSRGGLFEEIVKTEAEVRTGENQIQQMVNDPSVDLSRIMRANAEHIETKAYLKGLKFQGSQSTACSAGSAPVSADGSTR